MKIPKQLSTTTIAGFLALGLAIGQAQAQTVNVEVSVALQAPMTITVTDLHFGTLVATPSDAYDTTVTINPYYLNEVTVSDNVVNEDDLAAEMSPGKLEIIAPVSNAILVTLPKTVYLVGSVNNEEIVTYEPAINPNYGGSDTTVTGQVITVYDETSGTYMGEAIIGGTANLGQISTSQSYTGNMSALLTYM